MKDNVIMEKSLGFALRVIEVHQLLTSQRKEYVMSKQLLRSGTSIGANLREANLAVSHKEFIAKVQISLE